MENKVGGIFLPIPEKIGVGEDKKTHAKYFSLPFELPDGTKAGITIVRLDRHNWTPSKDLKSIMINFQ